MSRFEEIKLRFGFINFILIASVMVALPARAEDFDQETTELEATANWLSPTEHQGPSLMSDSTPDDGTLLAYAGEDSEDQESSGSGASVESEEKGTTRTKQRRVKIIKRRSSLRMVASLSNERFLAKRDSTTANINMQFYGYGLSYTYNSPMSNPRFRWAYTFGATLGLAKGKARETGILDELRNQPFVIANFTPGISWRTTAESEVVLGVPIVFRYIAWQINKASGLIMNKDQSYSAGGSLTYINYFTKRAQLIADVSHQVLWSATTWSVGLGYLF